MKEKQKKKNKKKKKKKEKKKKTLIILAPTHQSALWSRLVQDWACVLCQWWILPTCQVSKPATSLKNWGQLTQCAG